MKILILSTLVFSLLAWSEAPIETGHTGIINQPTDKKPNILLLYMDDLRPELNSYGHKQIISPNIDALAKRSVQFTQAYSLSLIHI